MKKALSLAELLLAISIMALVCSFFLLIFVNCIILNKSNRNLTVAVNHAQDIYAGNKSFS